VKKNKNPTKSVRQFGAAKEFMWMNFSTRSSNMTH
jgi:hypothetical protein